jgi:MYXO-CTERM domain-containing protein
MSMRRVGLGLVVGGLLLAHAATAGAQTNQIRPRVMVMIDTSGSMAFHFNDNNTTGGDGSSKYQDGVLTRQFVSDKNLSLYIGRELGGSADFCGAPSSNVTDYDGVNSRLFAAKQALSNVISGAGEIDWGLMRYTGTTCAVADNTFTPDANLPNGTPTNKACNGRRDCASGRCKNNRCVCNNANNNDCIAGACNVATGICSINPCTTGANCASGTCTNGKCVCNSAADCTALGNGADICVNGVCGTTPAFTSNGRGCASDNDCGSGQFCVSGVCGTDAALCNGDNDFYGQTDTRGGTFCGYHNGDVNLTFAGGCGNGATSGTGNCPTSLVCYPNPQAQPPITGDLDCNNPAQPGQCVKLPNSAAFGCRCDGNFSCPGNYTCTNGFCVYNRDCTSDGGDLLIDPSTQPSSKVLPWGDGIEIFTAGTDPALKNITNPELRANGGTPLAGAARTATTWYSRVIASDPQKTCRPYVLVQMTDGVDSCENDGNLTGDTTAGPIAAAAGFVAATTTGAKTLNKVYVIGLADANTAGALDAIAAAGGTGQARSAHSQQDIEAALADIVASSVLVEKCNGIDDNCNGQCDENFPGVEVDNPPIGTTLTCSNPHPAATCDNGWPQTTTCYAADKFVCSGDQLSQVCNAPTCTVGTGAALSSPSQGVMRVSGVNGIGNGAVGQLLYISGASKPANNGVFLISAVGTNTVDVTNAAVAMPDGNKVAYGLTSLQGSAAVTTGNGAETLTITTAAKPIINTGDPIIVVGGAAADDGTFAIGSVNSTKVGVPPNVTWSTTITFPKANAVASTVQWVIPRYCPNVETCNQKDDDCNGIVDDCTPGVAGSCCHLNCPPCAQPPFIETCNNCDDDCDGIIDNHLVDTGLQCGSNVGDCAPGTTVCCSNDISTGAACALDHVNDRLQCQGGNPGYPKPADLCDGTDDNCNGVANDNPPTACYVDATSGKPFDPSLDGKGICHAGTKPCLTPALPAGSAGCPVPWPAGKTCPNPNHSYGDCAGGVGPQKETCNGLDDDCNGQCDDNPQDTWINTECCSTGNLADCDPQKDSKGNPIQGTPCHRGSWQCVRDNSKACAPGTRQCVNSFARTVEVCDTIDNDCDGKPDDVPGLGNPCTGTGIITGGSCRAVLQCPSDASPTKPLPPVCVQTVGPMPEVCNGKDDNCNGEIDDTDPPLAPPGGVLPGVGVVCDPPMSPADKPPCKAGQTICVAGNIICDGAVHPVANQCNGVSTDCTGKPNTNGNCPVGFQCYQGNCVNPCTPGEFPCPGGYVCQKETKLCVPDVCVKATCPKGFLCQVDKDGNAQCVDPCISVSCPTGYICDLGTCVDGSCRTQGCPNQQICIVDSTGPNCQPDPCLSVTCMGNQFCDNGKCHNACLGPCPPGQFCDDGTCVDDPCRKTSCFEGQVCTPVNGVGVCVENQCLGGCNPGQACCGGACIADPCAKAHCSEDTHCVLNSACKATCETNPAAAKDQIVGAGGGGIGCSVAVGGAAPSRLGWAWLWAALGLIVLRRRRVRAAEVRR